ncbi:albusnodin/ikarugamycin family macrolactam cyclase [Streptomyces melanosporofaciens]|uniref:Asparagine synthase (Glutamine-hydrolysing) n=1 Tax=Streptomyces melanosporofaciens TaxID=67327 RepID=A0A1H4IEQ3_STRMJ|nr:albusnodin/ikarugamycin family macrolactam cyclase [Streptomyces melanosporofaciens]SEB31742.1 asparagine synthase (glutamine-hydrolysing) [Streptomyces melanosporofaciens]
MRWSAGWYGSIRHDRQPASGRAVPGLQTAWTCGWPAARVRTADAGPTALAVIGECGADDHHLQDALATVRAQKWRALTRWPGSYLTIARSGATLAVIGDLAGQHPVYYHAEASGTWWSTAASALAALDGAPVDATALAAHLALAQPDVLAARSLFRGVRRVPGGHLLLIGPDAVGTDRYEPVAYPSVDLRQAAPVVRTALAEAVATRIDDRPVSSDLAGLDSTTLACLAAQRGPVTAVTFADQRLRDDDLTFATRTAAAVPNLDHHPVPGAPETMYYAGLDDLGHLPVTDAPNQFAITASIKRTVLNTVAAHTPSPGVHFTGAAGDAVLSAPSSYLADLLRTGQRRRARQHAHLRARLRNTSTRTVLSRAQPAARTDLAGAWRQTAADLRAPVRDWIPQAQRPVAWTPLLASADWMTPDLRRHLAIALDQAADGLTEAPALLTDWTDRQDLTRLGVNTSGWRVLSAEYGIDLAAPYLDNEVIRACLAVPADQRGTPTRYKPLLEAAFAPTGLVPDFVLTRTTKGGFNALNYQGLTDHAPVLRELLGPSSRLAALGLATEQPVSAVLTRAATGQPTALGALHLIVAAEVWLRQLAAAPTRWWQEVTSHVAAA